MAVRVIGLGQRVAGDDGVGLAVLDLLHASPPPGVELHYVSDPAELVELIQSAERVVLVDAALGARAPGHVQALTADELRGGPLSPLSTHGISVAQAIELARVLGNGALPTLHVVAVGIDAPAGCGVGLSSAVAAAVPVAAAEIRQLVARFAPAR